MFCTILSKSPNVRYTVNFRYNRSARTNSINPLIRISLITDRRKVRFDIQVLKRMQVLNAQNTIFEAFLMFPLQKASKIEIGTRAFGYFDASSKQKIDPL